MFLFRRSATMPDPKDALPGRADAIEITEPHHVNGASLTPPWLEGTRTAVFGLGCFWGAEKAFWETDGVVSTAVGYAGGHTDGPTYREVCSGSTGHAEVVEEVQYDLQVHPLGHVDAAVADELGDLLVGAEVGEVLRAEEELAVHHRCGGTVAQDHVDGVGVGVAGEHVLAVLGDAGERDGRLPDRWQGELAELARRRTLERRVAETEGSHALVDWSVGAMGRRTMERGGGVVSDDGWISTSSVETTAQPPAALMPRIAASIEGSR